MSPCPPLSVIGKYVANGDIAPVSCVKKRRGEGFCYSLLRYPFLFSIVITRVPLGHVADGDVAPASRVNTGKRERIGSPESIGQ